MAKRKKQKKKEQKSVWDGYKHSQTVIRVADRASR
jgi:hypothetical protein